MVVPFKEDMLEPKERTYLTNILTNMKQILANPKLTPSEKMKLYQHQLVRYQTNQNLLEDKKNEGTRLIVETTLKSAGREQRDEATKEEQNKNLEPSLENNQNELTVIKHQPKTPAKTSFKYSPKNDSERSQNSSLITLDDTPRTSNFNKTHYLDANNTLHARFNNTLEDEDEEDEEDYHDEEEDEEDYHDDDDEDHIDFKDETAFWNSLPAGINITKHIESMNASANAKEYLKKFNAQNPTVENSQKSLIAILNNKAFKDYMLIKRAKMRPGAGSTAVQALLNNINNTFTKNDFKKLKEEDVKRLKVATIEYATTIENIQKVKDTQNSPPKAEKRKATTIPSYNPKVLKIAHPKFQPPPPSQEGKGFHIKPRVKLVSCPCAAKKNGGIKGKRSFKKYIKKIY